MTVHEPIYITTPLYYVNDELHLGHATTTIYADTLARFWRACGRPVLFLTGSDEHGQKIHKAATAAGTDPKSFADRIVGKFFELWDALDITYDVFIRTTDDFHKHAVQQLFTRLNSNGLVYTGKYEALYCVDCETNYTEKDLVEGRCPIHKSVPQKVQEENWFFRLSAFTDRVREHIEKHPASIVPEARRNEILGKLKEGLLDSSVSRTTFTWGVPLPWDSRHVLWVWSDALVNYISALGWPGGKALPTDAIAGRRRHQHTRAVGETPFAYWWPHSVHLVGKDILWHHTAVWWSMLLGAGISPPRQVFAHGWWTVEGDKMSKTLGNVIRPLDVATRYGRDALRYHVLREGPARGDADWRQALFVARYNADLANGLGNLVNRSLNMLGKYCEGKVPAEAAFADPALETLRLALGARVDRLFGALSAKVSELDLDGALEEIWLLVRDANAFVNTSAPFKLAKDPARKQDLQAAMHSLCQVVHALCHAVAPFLPDAGTRIAAQLQLAPGQPLPEGLRWGALPAGHQTGKPEPLFARIEEANA